MINRRQLFLGITSLLTEPAFSRNLNDRLLLRTIPCSGERIPVIGMGTSRTFDLEPDENLGQLMEVLKAFFISGGTVIDSSPMYGNAESTIGTLLSQIGFSTSILCRYESVDNRKRGRDTTNAFV